MILKRYLFKVTKNRDIELVYSLIANTLEFYFILFFFSNTFHYYNIEKKSEIR